MPLGLTNVHFEGNNGHADVWRCPLMTQSGHPEQNTARHKNRHGALSNPKMRFAGKEEASATHPRVSHGRWRPRRGNVERAVFAEPSLAASAPAVSKPLPRKQLEGTDAKERLVGVPVRGRLRPLVLRDPKGRNPLPPSPPDAPDLAGQHHTVLTRVSPQLKGCES